MASKKSKPRSGGASAAAGKPSLEVYYAARAAEDREWLRIHQPAALIRLEQLLADVRRTPFRGLGKPEPLRFKWSGWWSRRITREHRLVYKVEAGVLYVAQCRYHYEK
jgi:toxin YoeB